MITFRQHLEISGYAEKQGGIIEYIGRLEPSERVAVTRDIKETYPLKEPLTNHYKALDDFKCYFKVSELVLGQFIMIEQIITGKTKYPTEAENDFALAQLLMRPNIHDVFDNDDEEVEAQNSEAILNTDVREVYSVLQNFLKDRELVLFNQFKGVFYEVPDEDEEEQEPAEDKRGEALFQQQWYWYSMVRMLAKEDITKYEQIYMLNMGTVMPEMSFLAQKSKIDAAKQRRSEVMRKL
jgi:hypothetical protein